MKAQFTIILAAVAVLLVGSLLGNYLLYRGNRDLKDKNADLTEEIDDLEKKIDSLKKKISAGAPASNPSGHNRLRVQSVEPERTDDAPRRERAQRSDALAEAEPVEQPATNRVAEFRPFGRPPTAAEMRARFEEMRKQDPQRYTQITNNMARWRARRQERLQNQFELLAGADTAHMTKEQREVHETYQDLLLRQEELHELMNPNNADVTDEQREAVFKEMREIGHQLHELQRVERDTLLTQTANSLGLRGKQAQEVVTAIKAVYEATGSNHRGPHGGPGGGRGRR